MGANLLAASNYLIRLVRFEKEEQGKLHFEHKMRLSGAAFVATLVIIVEASPQGINFGSSSSSKKEEDIANGNYGQQTAPQIQQHQSQQCCRIPQQQQCLQNQQFTQGDDLVGEGLINERIVNRPGAAGQQTLSCALGQRICCYDDHPQDADYDLAFSNGTRLAASRSPPQPPRHPVVGFRAAVRHQFMGTSSVGQETTRARFEDFLRVRPVLGSSHGPV